MVSKPEDWLDRTLLLMRDELRSGVADSAFRRALTSTSVALVASGEDLASRSAQTAVTTAAILLARSGHSVSLHMPDVPLLAPVAPLVAGGIVSSLLALNGIIVPANVFTRDDGAAVDLAAIFGSAQYLPVAAQVVAVVAGPWSGSLRPYKQRQPWQKNLTWPFGPMTAATLVAAEAFKISMRKLRNLARNEENFDQLFAACRGVDVVLPPILTRTCKDLGDFDLISGGAISHAALYCLSRIDDVTGTARVIEYDDTDFPNLNRYMLLTVRDIPMPKIEHLKGLSLGSLQIAGVIDRFDFPLSSSIGTLAKNVLVGVDDIPTRWAVQLSNPEWLGIGATTHWSSMVSFHSDGLPCARCLHPRDDAAPNFIPTVAFVSFFAGLLLGAYFVRRVAGGYAPAGEQQTYTTILRPELINTMGLAFRRDCPICGRSKLAA